MRRRGPVAVALVVLSVATACAADEQDAPEQDEQQAPQGAADEAATDGAAPAAVLVLGELPDEATVAASAREIRASWPEAEPAAGSAVAGYEVQWRSGGQDWDGERRRVVIGLSYVIGGLDDGVAYTVRVRPAVVEAAEVQGASIVAGEGSAPTAQVVADPPPLNPDVHQSVSPLAGAVDFEMTGEPVWPATIIMPVDLDLVGDDDSVQLMFYNESLDLWVPSPGAVLDRERGVITAEVYHLTIGMPTRCLIPWACQVVTGTIDAGAEFARQQAARVARLLADWWDEAEGWLREGWSTTGEFVFGDLPELARQVLDRAEGAGRRLQPWVRAWLEAASDAERMITELYAEWIKSMTVKRFGYGIRPPSCEGVRPQWAAQPQLVPDTDILLYCSETAAGPGDGSEDLALKLTMNRSYGVTVRPGRGYTKFGPRAPGNIAVEQVDTPTDLGDLLGGAINLIERGVMVIPPGGTANLRVPLSSLLGGQDTDGDRVRFSADLHYNADGTSFMMQALILLLSMLAGGTTGVLARSADKVATALECALSLVADGTNADQSGDPRDLVNALGGIVNDCLVPVIPEVVKQANPVLLLIGVAEILHELGRVVIDGAVMNSHRVVAASQWVTRPDDSIYSPSLSAGRHHTCRVKPDNTIACWGLDAAGQTDAPAGSFSAVSAGDGHSCGLTTSGEIVCWGNNHSLQSHPDDGVFAAVTAGAVHTCGLRDNGTIACWGSQAQDGGRPVLVDAPEGFFYDVNAGSLHTCGVGSFGTISCWGDNSHGQTNTPPGNFWAVSAGGAHSCGLRIDNTIACWGDNDHGQTNTPEEGRYKTVSAGGAHTCAVSADTTTGSGTPYGVVTCWGNNSHGQRNAPPGNFKSVSAGANHTCGTRIDDTITCWGNNNSGQRDVPSATDPPAAGQTAPAASAVSGVIAAGWEHTCALRTDNTITCWGNNSQGQRDAPPGAHTALAASGNHTCALRTDNTITCWGSNDHGETDALPGTYSAVTAGWDHTCALQTNQTITCWGNNSQGQRDAPTGTYSAVAAGGSHSCALRTNGTITCWGSNYTGESRPPPGTYTAIAANGTHTCALRTDGTAACWGNPIDGLTNPPPGTNTAITAGGNHACALQTDNTITCWGNNEYGQTNPHPGTYTAVAAGGTHSCALQTDNTITCWGNNNHGQTDAPTNQFGPTDDTSTAETTPDSIYTATFRAFDAGAFHSCGLRTDDTITCWGTNPYSHRPIDAPSGTFKAVTAGKGHSCGLRTDDTIECWGLNDSGQADPPSGTFKAVTAGQDHSCAIRTHNTIECWGGNDGGQADPPSGTFKAVTAGGLHNCGLRTDDTITCWGTHPVSDLPIGDAPSGTFKAVTAGKGHSCGLRTDDTIECWGTSINRSADAPQGTFKSVTTGQDHSCAIRSDDTVTCWGVDSYGKTNAPTGTFKSVTAGSVFHSCGLRTDDTITCWGSARGWTTDRTGFKAIDVGGNLSYSRWCGILPDKAIVCAGGGWVPFGTFKAVTVGALHSCGLRTDDTIDCWGLNDSGQANPPQGTFKAVTAGSSHSCGLRTDDTIDCWGLNDSGQANPPQGTFKAVTAGSSHSCGLRTDDTIDCWGLNDSGQANPPQGTFKAVTAGLDHSCAIRSDDIVTCWGNDTAQANTPSGTFRTVAASALESCGLRTDGTIECWTSNDYDCPEC